MDNKSNDVTCQFRLCGEGHEGYKRQTVVVHEVMKAISRCTDQWDLSGMDICGALDVVRLHVVCMSTDGLIDEASEEEQA